MRGSVKVATYTCGNIRICKAMKQKVLSTDAKIWIVNLDTAFSLLPPFTLFEHAFFLWLTLNPKP